MMKKIIVVWVVLIACIAKVQAQQVGKANIAAMNNYIANYSASQMSALVYYDNVGMVEQANFGITERYKIHEIKRIEVSGKDKTFVVQFICAENDACISQTKEKELGKYIASLSYFFSNPSIANAFAQRAYDIIKNDFKKEATLSLIGDAAAIKEDATPRLKDEKAPIIKEKKTVVPKKKVPEDHLSLNIGTASNDEAVAERSPFMKKVNLIIASYSQDKLESLKGAAANNAWSAKLKLPKAKKNYINTFKNENCFVAEFGTQKFIDDLEDTYYDLQDELDDGMTQDWEMIDHSQDAIYDDAESDIFHIEYRNEQQKDAPSITLMVVPDGKRYTLFMRIGSK